MKEFAFGTAQQFAQLDIMISDSQCHVYNNCTLPASCTPDHARLGFEKAGKIYIMYIDRGISTTSANPDFIRFLQLGEARFNCLVDMIDFLHSLQPLFDAAAVHMPVTPAAAGPSMTVESDVPIPDNEVVDMAALVAERKQRAKCRLVNPEAISTPLKQKVFGQDEAINTLAELVVLNRMRKEKKLLVAMLLGPTATGKSETAKSLADVLSEVYGTQYGFIELAGSEFIGEHSVHRFFGAPPGYIGHGQPTALDAVRENPFHVIVINEIEKGDPRLIEGLMETLDNGYLGMADNSKPIDLNQCILLFTSNLPIDMQAYASASDFQRAEMCRDAFTKHCGRPEISGKIGNFIVYRELATEPIARIVIKFIRKELDSYDLKLGSIDQPLMQEFLDRETAYGARAIAGTVGATVGRQLMYRILQEPQQDALAGKTVALRGTLEDIQFDIY